MTIGQYAYPAEKLHQARHTLMAPHPGGEAASFAGAFELCGRCRNELDQVDDDQACHWIETIRKIMDTSGLDDPEHRGLFIVRAEQLTLDEKTEFSRVVDELASWVNEKFYSGDDA